MCAGSGPFGGGPGRYKGWDEERMVREEEVTQVHWFLLQTSMLRKNKKEIKNKALWQQKDLVIKPTTNLGGSSALVTWGLFIYRYYFLKT